MGTPPNTLTEVYGVRSRFRFGKERICSQKKLLLYPRDTFSEAGKTLRVKPAFDGLRPSPHFPESLEYEDR